MRYGDVQANWADAIWATLAANGVEHVVVSPGSRSTPLVLALTESDLNTHVLIDERSAGFFALGIARARKTPVALVCTSGTAGAHYLPAAIEAREAGHPLVILTADRPTELQGMGASQTTEQRFFFGAHALFSATLGLPSQDGGELAASCSLIARAVGTATRRRGPVHVNVPMRKPFEPSANRECATSPSIPRVLTSSLRPDDDAIATIADHIDDSDAGWVLAGPSNLNDEDAEAVREFCARSGFLLVCEPGSSLRDGATATRSGTPFRRADGFELALEAADQAHAYLPDVVLQLGPALVSRSLNQVLDKARGSFTHITIAEFGWHDANRSTSMMALGSIGETVRRVTAALVTDPEDNARLDEFASACTRVWDQVLAALLHGADRASGPGVLRTVVAALPDGGTLFIGNSRPIRDLSEFCHSLPASVGVLTQRGVAGIDGNISGITGTASTTGVPVTGIIGDIAFLHDASALLSHQLVRTPAVLIVINNGGGRIFGELPLAEAPGVDPATFEKFWVTPQDASPSAIARAYGVEATTCDSLPTLSAALTIAYQRNRLSVIEVQVDAELSAEIRRRARVPIEPETEA